MGIRAWRALNSSFLVLLSIRQCYTAAISPPILLTSNQSVSVDPGNEIIKCIPYDDGPSSTSLAVVEDCYVAFARLPNSADFGRFHRAPRPHRSIPFELPRSEMFQTCRITVDIDDSPGDLWNWAYTHAAAGRLINECTTKNGYTGGVARTGKFDTMPIRVQNRRGPPLPLNVISNLPSIENTTLASPSQNHTLSADYEFECFNAQKASSVLASVPDCYKAIEQFPSSSLYPDYFHSALRPDPSDIYQLPRAEVYGSCEVMVELAFVRRELATWAAIGNGARSLTTVCTSGKFPHNKSGGIVHVGRNDGIRGMIGKRNAMAVPKGSNGTSDAAIDVA